MYHSIMNRIEGTHETVISLTKISTFSYKAKHIEVEFVYRLPTSAWHLITSPSQNIHICMSGKKHGSNYAAPVLNAIIIRRRTCTSKGPLLDFFFFAGHMNNSAYVCVGVGGWR